MVTVDEHVTLETEIKLMITRLPDSYAYPILDHMEFILLQKSNKKAMVSLNFQFVPCSYLH